jgi:putative Mn2+ efflux pump MntP
LGWMELALVAIGLSMDAFAAAMCKGIAMKKIDMKQAALIALFFGGFQAIMPLAGYFLGSRFEQYIVSIDHWLIFALLGFIGGKMIAGSRSDGCRDDACAVSPKVSGIGELFGLAFATSMDALAVGITFAILGPALTMGAIAASLAIGAVTFCLSGAGVAMGSRFGVRYQSRAELAGGIILIGIGVRILIEHLM